jgi:hypothetical protein
LPKLFVVLAFFCFISLYLSLLFFQTILINSLRTIRVKTIACRNDSIGDYRLFKNQIFEKAFLDRFCLT